jgi:hypothetical protein
MLNSRARDFNSSPATVALEHVIHKQQKNMQQDVLVIKHSSTFQAQEQAFDSFPVIQWQDDVVFPDYNLSPGTTTTKKQRTNAPFKKHRHDLVRSMEVKSALSMLADEGAISRQAFSYHVISKPPS